MNEIYVEPADRSSTVTKVVAVIVAILRAGYIQPWAIAAVREDDSIPASKTSAVIREKITTEK
jgi:hypothetical protein